MMDLIWRFILFTLFLVACAPDQEANKLKVDPKTDETMRLAMALNEIGNILLPNMPFDFCVEGCYAKSYLMQAIFSKHKIPSRALFLNGVLEPTKGLKWKFHVAPMIRVGDQVKVIDPSLRLLVDHRILDRKVLVTPMAVDEWLKIAGGETPLNQLSLAVTSVHDFPQFLDRKRVPDEKTILYLNPVQIDDEKLLFESISEPLLGPFQERYLNKFVVVMKRFNLMIHPQLGLERNIELDRFMEELKLDLEENKILQRKTRPSDSKPLFPPQLIDTYEKLESLVLKMNSPSEGAGQIQIHSNLGHVQDALSGNPGPSTSSADFDFSSAEFDASLDRISEFVDNLPQNNQFEDVRELLDEMLKIPSCQDP